MPRTRVDEHGHLVELHPETLDCGHPFSGNVTIHFESPSPDEARRRSYRCKTCRAITWD